MVKVNTKDKKSFGSVIKNALFALSMGFTFSKSIVIHSFFMWLIGHGGWVFFDGIFLKKIVDDLDNGAGFWPIFSFIAITGLIVGTGELYRSYVENVVFPLKTNRLFGGIYKKLYEKARNVELRCYEDSDFYDSYTKAMDGAEEKVTAVIDGIFGSFIGALAASAVFYLMYEIDHYAILFIISPLIGNFLFGNLKSRYEYLRYSEQVPNDKVLNYVSRMMYLPDGAKEIRLSNVFSLFREQYHKATEGNTAVAQKYAFANANLNFWKITFTFTVIFEGVLIYSIYRNRVSGTVSLAELTIMTSLMVAMTWILINMFNSIMNVIKNSVFLNNLREFLDYEETIPEDKDGIMPDPEFERLELKNVSFSYKSEKTIDDLSFVITKGQIAALVGHNGAGKTTIIKLLLRMYDPDSGVILYNGIDIREYNLRAYREVFAATFQDFQLFGMTVKENVLMGRTYENEDEMVEKALKKAGVYDKVMTLKDGINTMMTKEFEEDGAVLSGGESQKIAVARTFIKDASMKIFDEPSSALDPIAEYELFKNIMKEGKDHTMLFISHRLSSVKSCDKVFMLENGHLIEEGSHEELMAHKGSYAKMYEKQAMNYLALDNVEGVAL